MGVVSKDVQWLFAVQDIPVALAYLPRSRRPRPGSQVLGQVRQIVAELELTPAEVVGITGLSWQTAQTLTGETGDISGETLGLVVQRLGLTVAADGPTRARISLARRALAARDAAKLAADRGRFAHRECALCGIPDPALGQRLISDGNRHPVRRDGSTCRMPHEPSLINELCSP